MSNTLESRLITLNQPIFSSAILKDYLIIAAGGGGKKYEVLNTLISYRINKRNGTIVKEPCLVKQFEKEIPVWVNCLESQNIFLVCIDNLVVFYFLNENDGTFEQIYSIKTLDYFDIDIYQTCCRISKSGKFLACGSSDGNLKIFQLQINQGKVVNHKLLKDFQTHVRDINDIIIIENKNMLVTCSSDATCKVFELNSLKILTKLTFRTNVNEKKGYLFRSIYYDENNNYIYTTQAPLIGDSYITKWNVNKGFKPIDSAKIGNVSTCCIDYDYNSNTLAIGDNKGSVIFMDAGSMHKNKEMYISDLSIKTVKYIGNGYLITGCADNSIRCVKNYSKGIISFFGFLKMLLILFLAYVGFLIQKEKKFEFDLMK